DHLYGWHQHGTPRVLRPRTRPSEAVPSRPRLVPCHYRTIARNPYTSSLVVARICAADHDGPHALRRSPDAGRWLEPGPADGLGHDTQFRSRSDPDRNDDTQRRPNDTTHTPLAEGPPRRPSGGTQFHPRVDGRSDFVGVVVRFRRK